jgi:hypothetical protein
MIGALITLIIYIIVLGLLVWLINYVVDAIPLGEPFNRLAKLLIVVVAVIIVIFLLLQLVGGGGLNLPRIQ